MRKGKKRAITGFGFVLLFLFAGSIFCYFNFKTVIVEGHSMEPTFYTGRKLLVSHAYWLIGQIKRNDIVVVKDEGPNKYFIKRVYRLPGEEVDYVNWPRNYSLKNDRYIVPEGTLFVLGDNRRFSEDSRSFGPVDLSRVLGKVVIAR